MALTNAERQRRHREKREAEHQRKEDAASAYIRRSFADFFAADVENGNDGGDWDGIKEVLAYAGVPTLPDLTADEWPEFENFGLASSGLKNTGALGRAELLAGAMQECLRVLSAKLNRFKREEVMARIDELVEADLSDPQEKKRALDEIVELRRIASRLDKGARLTFPAYEIKG